jgi:hypothetical protein
MGSNLAHPLQKHHPCAGEQKKPARNHALLALCAFGNSANHDGRMQDNDVTGSRAMKKGNFAVGQRVRLKWELDPPVNIPAGAIGQVTRVSPWDVWVRFEKRIVRLPFSEVEQEGFAADHQRRTL